jgi:hypothetical protein
MKTSELIEILSKLDPEKEISIFWDGGARGDVEGIVDTDNEVVIVGEWSIYRDTKYRRYPEEQIVFG